MPRALAGAVGAMLAIAVGVVTPGASAQAPAPQRQSPPMPVRADNFPRLEELKVELALLSDLVTFPYSIAVTAHGENLELYGFVPNHKVRQHALEVARRTTPLTVHETLGLRPTQGLQPTPRPSSVLQKEGAELLQKELGETAKQVSLETRSNGLIVVNGRIDSVENKVNVSRLFRQLPGCAGVVNKLTVEPIVREGARVVRVMQDGSLLVPPSLLGLKESMAASPQPTLLLTKTQSVPKREGSLPTVIPPKSPSPTLRPIPASQPPKPPSPALKPIPASPPPKSVPVKIENATDPFAPSKLPVKWGRPASGWETQANELEKLHTARQQALMPTPIKTPKRAAEGPSLKPVSGGRNLLDSVHQGDYAPRSLEVGTVSEPKKVQLPTATIKPSQAILSPRPNFAEARPTPRPNPMGQRPAGYEESEPKSLPQTRNADTPVQSPPSVRSSRRWPPAYVTGSPPSQGRPGVIVFEDDPPRAKPTTAPIAPSRPIGPAELQRRIKALCGQEARDVMVATQRDGSVLVRVKVANRSIEDQLSRKILGLPEMNAPKVRLLMEVGP